ncbi:MAG: nucleotide sugar dehydrogenase [Pseudomonadota bacterium]
MNHTALHTGMDIFPLPAKRRDEHIAILGLGYVGLPLGLSFARSFANVTGYDIAEARVRDLIHGKDMTGEVTATELNKTTMVASCHAADLAEATTFIVTVPTPIDAFKQPDLKPLQSACATVARYLKPGDLVMFESTVYPGVTEEVCVPILEEFSGLTAGDHFNFGYSPERINPGDKLRPFRKIAKLISADSDAALTRAEGIYRSVIDADLHLCASIKIAEAAKALENTQRDVNIALMNEMSEIFDRINVPVQDVIRAASTKWNFLPFTPGLVGGHCIGVDPHYLIALAEREGVAPTIISSARRANTAVPDRILKTVLKHAAKRKGPTRVAQLGLTFKPDVPDIRNSLSLRLAKDLVETGLDPMFADPFLDQSDVDRTGIQLSDPAEWQDVDILILSVPHAEILTAAPWANCLNKNALVIDVSSAIPKSSLPSDAQSWSL